MNSVTHNSPEEVAGEIANRRSLGQRAALALIRAYQLMLSPWIGRQCRFYPTCSHYASEAIEAHGVCKGAYLSARRLGKCHPFHPGGVDLVPEPAKPTQTHNS